jgi:hypothetical protein
MKGSQPLAIYAGGCELPEEVINHEFSTRQMRDILKDHGYKLLRYA